MNDVKQTAGEACFHGLACLYIHFLAVFNGISQSCIHFILVGLLSSDSYQIIFLAVYFFFFYIYTVEKSFKCNQEVICQVQCSPNVQTRARLQKKNCYIWHYFEYETDPLQWTGLLLLHFFLSKLLKLLEMICSLCRTLFQSDVLFVVFYRSRS